MGGIFGAPFLGKKEKRKRSTPNSTAKKKSNFGSFAAKVHTARIWPSYFPARQHHSKRLGEERMSGRLGSSLRPRRSLESRTVVATGPNLTWKVVKTAEKRLLSKSPTAVRQEESRGDSKRLQPSNCEIEVIKQTTFSIGDRFFNHAPSPQKAPLSRWANCRNRRRL